MLEGVEFGDGRADPLRGPGPGDRRGADARLHERGVAAADGGDRRGPLLQPLARRDLAQGRELGQHASGSASLRYDCDGDAILALVEPAGPACHTGERSCFYRDLGGSAATTPDAPAPRGSPSPVAFEAPALLERTLRSRAAERPAGSYTVELLDDPARIGEKVAEEAEEVVRAARSESDERVAEEAADLLYHLAVLLVSRGVPLGR